MVDILRDPHGTMTITQVAGSPSFAPAASLGEVPERNYNSVVWLRVRFPARMSDAVWGMKVRIQNHAARRVRSGKEWLHSHYLVLPQAALRGKPFLVRGNDHLVCDHRRRFRTERFARIVDGACRQFYLPGVPRVCERADAAIRDALRAVRHVGHHSKRRRVRDQQVLAVPSGPRDHGIRRSGDGLTNVLNRRAFDAAFARITERARVVRDAVGILLIDIDYFKAYNDRFGHLAGDDCLIAAAQACASCVRSSDVFARFGGEEFAAIVPSATRDDLDRIAQRMLSAVAELRVDSGNGSFVTVNDVQRVLRIADENLYSAKLAGRNRVVLV